MQAEGQGERATLPLTLQLRPLQGGCPSQDEISEIHDEVRSVLQDTVEPIRRQAAQDLNGTNSSDSIQAAPNSCEDNVGWTSSRSTGGWTRVAFLNMTDPMQLCPSACMDGDHVSNTDLWESYKWWLRFSDIQHQWDTIQQRTGESDGISV